MQTHSSAHERKTLIVIILTLLTMIAEIAFGYLSHSMALLADGYHMGTHALALGLSYIAYIFIRKYKNSPRFAHGTSKIGTLTAYTSSLFLGITGVWIIWEAASRLWHPVHIIFNEAILVAFIGLTVNAACIAVMETGHANEAQKHTDYNFKAAYYHILADLLTSILAILALVIGKYLGWTCLDALMGLLGGALIVKWAVKLLKDTVAILIDMQPAP